MKRFLSIISIAWGVCLLAPAARGEAWRVPRFRGLSMEQGLSDYTVNALYKDSAGFVWVGTGNSLERFDGIHLKAYRITGPVEKRKRVQAIAEPVRGEIWMGNGAGLWRLDKEEDRLAHMAPGRLDMAVHALLPDGHGGLYVGTDAGLFIYREGQFEQLWIDKNTLAPSNRVLALALGAAGELWLATEGGLYAVDLRDCSVTPALEGPAYRSVARIGDRLYLGTMGQGIVRFDTRTRRAGRFADVGSNVISSLSTDGKDLLYVGTDGNGVHFVSADEGRVVRSFRHEIGGDGGLRSNSVYSLLVDREGLIWVGFYQLGLDYTLYQNGLFETYRFADRFDSREMPVRCLAIREGEKLIGSRDGLFFIDEWRGRFRSYRAPELRASMIMCCCYFAGRYYVGTYGGGLYVLDPETMRVGEFPAAAPVFRRGQIFCLRPGPEGQLWIGTSEGLFAFDGKRVTEHHTARNSRLPEGNVYEIFFDSTRRGWICTENGLCLRDPASGTLRTDLFPEGFIQREKIRVVYEDAQHRLYFFPDKGSLFRSDLSLSRFSHLPPGTPLDGKDGMFLLEDGAGWLWIGTSNGLYRYDKAETFIPYTFEEGIPSPIFTYCPPVRDAEGRLWFGNSKGLLAVDAARCDSMPAAPYPIALLDILVNGRERVTPSAGEKPGTYAVRLASDQKNFTIDFSGLSYTDPSSMLFEYKLEGYDEKEWRLLAGEGRVTYYNLPARSYRFRLRRAAEPESEVAMAVRVAWPAWAWMLPGGLLLLGGGLFVAYRWRRPRCRSRSSCSLKRRRRRPRSASTRPRGSRPRSAHASGSCSAVRWRNTSPTRTRS